MKTVKKELAHAIRVEYDSDNDDLFIVFEVTDERFKKQLKDDWLKDINLKIEGKKLIKIDIEEK